MNIELQILDAIQSIRTPAGDVLMPLISDGLIIWLILPAILLLRKETRRAGIIILTAMVIDYGLCNLLLKNLFQRVRPCDVNTAVDLLVSRPTDYSFPSGHTALSFAALTGLWYSDILKKWRVPALVLACLIAFSRMYLYVHYPTDILAGILVGIFCGWAAVRVVEKMWKREQLEEVTA